MISAFFGAVSAGESLSEAEASQCLEVIFDGGVSDEDIAAFLVALAKKGETADEVVGFMRVLQAHAIGVELGGDCIDVCGTGGSGLSRFNVSTAVAFVLAAAGVPVAKHGNRGSRRPNGSFDLLEALGCSFELSAGQVRALFDATGLCFLYARTLHPAMKKVVRARQLAARRTIFNLAAPLSNPANPRYQVVGTPHAEGAALVAEILTKLDRERFMVAVGAPGIDEVSISGETLLIEGMNGKTSARTLNPVDLGIDPVPYEKILSKTRLYSRAYYAEMPPSP